jgi:hypothetical protein
MMAPAAAPQPLRRLSPFAMTGQLVVTNRGIVGAGLADQFYLFRADLGIGCRHGFPQNLFPQRQLDAVGSRSRSVTICS